MELRAESKDILSLIQKKGPLTKNSIKDITGYTLTSLNRFLKPLLDYQLIHKAGLKESEGGRPSTQYDIDTTHYGLIGIDISRTYCTLILSNLKMDVIYDAHIPLDKETMPDELIQWLITQINTLKDSSPFTILGVGIGIVGPVDKTTGAILTPEHFQNTAFSSTNFYEQLNLSLDLPIIIDSGAAAALRFESFFGDAKNHINTAYINCGVSIRDSVLIHHMPISDGLAYENKLAHMTINYNGRTCSCGNTGCIDAYSGLHGMTLHYNNKTHKHLTYQELLNAPNEDRQLEGIIHKGAEALGIGIANFIRLFSLDYVVIGGPLALNHAHYYDVVIKTANQHIKNAPNKQVKFSKGGSKPQLSMAIGGACTFFERYLLDN